ncbi:MAG: presenilin family intramembrane aspartyl protease [Candidatus Micrarchaeota archaeon]
MKKVFALALLGFFLVQLLALFVGAQFIELIKAGQIEPIVANPSDPANAAIFFAYIVFGAVVLLIVLRYYKGRKLFLLAELLLFFTAFQVLAMLFVSELTALAIGAAVVAARLLKPGLRSPLLLVTAGVVGALLGANFDLLPAVILALLLSGYDIVAVFYTKHMVTLAKELSGRDAAFSVVFSTAPGAKRAPFPKAKGVKTRIEALELGTGDLVIPAFVATAALKLPGKGLFIGGQWIAGAAVAALVGSLAGMIVLFILLERKRGYWPALPPLVITSLLALAVYLLT